MADIAAALKRFGLRKPEQIRQIYDSAWEVDSRYVLKKCHSLEQTEISVLLSRMLWEDGIPAAVYHRTAEGSYTVSEGGGFYCLMTKIQGHHMDPYAGEPFDNGIVLGKLAARLHTALARLGDIRDFYDCSLISELKGWIAEEITRRAIPVRADILDYCLSFEPLYRTLPRQLIHRDLHPQNMLFDDGGFAGFLDFDISQKNIRLFDLCYLGTSQLYENYQNPDRLGAWQSFFTGVLRGYDKVSPLTAGEREGIPAILVSIALLFTAYFSSVNQPDRSEENLRFTEWLYDNRAMLTEVAS